MYSVDATYVKIENSKLMVFTVWIVVILGEEEI